MSRQMVFSCEREGLFIRGMQIVPDSFCEEKKYPSIILCHGFTGNYSDLLVWSDSFTAMGYVVYTFSFCGGSRTDTPKELCSAGETTDMNISTEVKDLESVLQYVVSRPWTDETHIVLGGFSQGGFVAGITAARNKEMIEKLILIFPALCIPDHARRGCLGGSSYDVQAVPEVISCSTTKLGRQFHQEMAEMDPFLELEAYEGPVLLIHGIEDVVVNYSYAIRAREAYKKGQCHLQLVRNMNHGFETHQMESTMASIRQFLLGKKEILSIRVIITECKTYEKADYTKKEIFFTGYCETPYFQGTILPGGLDVRKEYPDGSSNVRAEYELCGLDNAKESCHIHIVNQWGDIDWKPQVTTDSKALSWMNTADLTAVLEYGDGGPTVRIFA